MVIIIQKGNPGNNRKYLSRGGGLIILVLDLLHLNYFWNIQVDIQWRKVQCRREGRARNLWWSEENMVDESHHQEAGLSEHKPFQLHSNTMFFKQEPSWVMTLI